MSDRQVLVLTGLMAVAGWGLAKVAAQRAPAQVVPIASPAGTSDSETLRLRR